MKLTKKYVRNNFKHVIGLNYGIIQSLTPYMEKMGHVERLEGWGSDIFMIDWDVAISTGYAPITSNVTKEQMNKINELARKYEKLAYNVPCNTAKRLSNKFVNEVLEIVMDLLD